MTNADKRENAIAANANAAIIRAESRANADPFRARQRCASFPRQELLFETVDGYIPLAYIPPIGLFDDIGGEG